MTVDLDDFVREFAASLGLQPEFEVDDVLALASSAAHEFVRPAAPVATFLAGVAAGRAGASPQALASALAQARGFFGTPPAS